MYHIVDKMKSGGLGLLPTARQDIPPGHGGLIELPDINDVLSGRGGRINNHQGNIYYRKLVTTYKHSYLDKNTKKLDKVKIADHIVVMIRNNNPSGRFLKEDPQSKLWKEIGDEKARKKAGQAMREGATKTRRQLEEGTVTPIAINSPVNALSPLTSRGHISPDHPQWNNQVPMSALSNRYNAGSIPSPVISHPGSYEDNRPILSGAYITPDSVPSGYAQAGAAFDSNNLHIAPRLDYAAYGQSIMPMPSGFPTQQLSPHRPYSDIGKTSQSTIPEDKPPPSAKENRNDIIGAGGAAFNRTFNPLSDSTSTSTSSNGNMSSIKSMNSKSTSTSISSRASISIKSMSPTPVEKPSADEMSDEDDEETKRNKYRQMVELNSAGAARYSETEPLKNFQDNQLGGCGLGDPDSDRSYLPHQLTKRTTSNSSMQLSDVRGLSRGSDRSISSPLIGSVKDMSLNEEYLHDLLGSSEANLNGPALKSTGEDKDWVNTSQNSKSSSSNSSDARRERLKSETSLHDQMSFRFERGTSGGNSSSDAMSIDSRRSSNSGWLQNFKGMNGLPPGGDLRARFFSDCSNRSMFSELSSDMLALDLAADPLLFLDPPSPPISPPTSP